MSTTAAIAALLLSAHPCLAVMPAKAILGRGDVGVRVPREAPAAFPPGFVHPGLDDDLWERTRGAGALILDDVKLSTDRTADLWLERVNVFAPDATIVVMRDRGRGVEAESLDAPPVALFRGGVAGDPDSFAFIAVAPSFTHGWVQSGGRTFLLSSGPAGRARAPVAFDAREGEEIIHLAPFTCDAEALPGYAHAARVASEQAAQGGIAGGSGGCRLATVAIETDHEYTANLFGGDVDAAAAYAAMLISACSEIYVEAVGVRFEIGFLRLWETPDDPWTQPNTSLQLPEFRDYWLANEGGIERTSAHLLSGRSLGGGIAWLPSLCDEAFSYAVSSINGTFPYPLEDHSEQNWDVMVTAHEFGHNFGAPHTHSYDPPIDGCGNGDCSEAANGTIMSYCHLCPGGLANIALHFAPENIASIENYLDATNPCVPENAPPAGAPDFAVTTPGVPIEIDVLANDLPANCEVVSLVGVDATSAGGATLSICTGCGPGGRDTVIYTPDESFSGFDIFTYVLEGGDGEAGSGTVTVEVVELRIPDLAVVAPGVATDYYVVAEIEYLPDFDALTPYASDVVSSINFSSTGGDFAGSGRADLVGAVFTGYIDAPVDGIYELSIESDDGSRLLVGDRVVVNNDGLHAMVEKTGSIGLKAGLHEVRVEFFELFGGAGMIVRWTPPGMTKSVIPPGAWFRPGTPDLTGDGVVDGADLGALLAQWGMSGSADLDASGVVDGADLGLLLSAWTSS